MQFDTIPNYWAETPYEVDFVIQKENDVFPVEVKAGESVSSVSLKNYRKKFERETPFAVRLSLKNLSLDGNVLNVPLFMADWLRKLIELVRGNV